jgi:hypothetical protein
LQCLVYSNPAGICLILAVCREESYAVPEALTS